MKTRFPLFTRLLLWFFLNLLVLLAALWLTLRIEFGPQYHGFLPDTSRPQTQAMAEVLIGDLAKTPRDHWNDVLARLGSAYRMQFALFDGNATPIAGASIDLPPEARTMILMTGHNQPPREMTEGSPPLDPPPPFAGPDGAPPPGTPPPPGRPHQLLPEFPQHVIRTDHPETYWLLVHLPMNRLPGADLLPAMLVGETQTPEGNALFFNPHPWLVLGAGMIVFSTIFWLVLTRSLTAAITRMTRATEEIAEGRFDVRAIDRRSDELGRLGFAINRMAARLKGFITGQRRFLGDAAHELCSPLARMEVALGILEERSDERTLSYVRDVRDEVTHMRKLAHELLSFSKAALGENRIRLKPVPVAEVAAEAVAQEHGDGRVQIDVPAALRVQADRDLLLRALANLVRNALRYAGDAGPITISAWAAADAVVISVADEGPGVPAGELERLFDPFYRLDESRGAETGGAGLGLAIVKTCIEACHGTATALQRQPRGLEIQLRCLPATFSPERPSATT